MHEIRLERINPATLAIFEGGIGALWGLALSMVVFIQVSVFGAALTDNMLQGLMFGFSATAASLVLIPLFYFGIGWVLGYMHALISNVITQSLAAITTTPHARQMPNEQETFVGARPAMTFGERIETKKTK